MKKFFLLFIANIFLLFLVGCNKAQNEPDSSPVSDAILIYATIPPQQSIIKAIGGQYVNIEIMTPPNMDPHDYQPKPSQILNLANAQAYFEIGLPFEKILGKELREINSNVQFFSMSHDVKPIVNNINGVKIVDPHIWLSPKDLKIIAKNTYNYLVILQPKHKEYFLRNYKNYINKLNSVYIKLKKKLTPYRGKTFFVFHPAFGYFARDFGLKQQAVEIDGLSPPPKALLSLITKAKEMGIKIIFVEPQFSKKTAEALAREINGSVISINPLSIDVISNFEKIADKLKYSFSMEKK